MAMRGWTQKAIDNYRGRQVLDTSCSAYTRGGVSYRTDVTRNKYHAVTSVSSFPDLAGRKFASKGERDRADQLVLLQSAGLIAELVFQDKVDLGAGITWRLDFRYREAKSGVVIWEDFKGKETDLFRIKLKLWGDHGPGPLKITRRIKGRIVITDTITPCNPVPTFVGSKK